MAASLSVTLKHTGTNLSARTATVSVEVYVTTTGDSYNLNYPSGSYHAYANPGTVSGEANKTFNSDIPANSTTKVGSGTVTVGYSELGTATVSVEATFRTGISAGTLTKTATLKLPDIGQKASGSIAVEGLSSSGENYLGQSFPVILSLPNVSGTPTLGYNVYVQSFGTMPSGGRVIGTGTGSPGEVVRLQWATRVGDESYIPNQSSGVCTIRADISSASGVVFTSLETSFTLRVRDEYAPTIGDIEITDSTGMYDDTGILVSGKSDVTVSTTATPQGAAEIETVRLYFNGVAYQMSHDDSTGEWSAHVGIYRGSGDVTGYVRAQDSRGFSTTKYLSASGGGQNIPMSGECRAYRYNTSTGEEDDESTTVRLEVNVTLEGTGSSADGGTIRIRYMPSNTGTWTTFTTVTTDNASYSNYFNVTDISTTYGCSFEILATNKLGDETTIILEVGSAKPVIDFHEDDGIAFWGVATGSMFSVNNSIRMEGANHNFYTKTDNTSAKALFEILTSGGTASSHYPVFTNGVDATEFRLADVSNKSNPYFYDFARLWGDHLELYWPSDGIRGDMWTRLWSGSWTQGGRPTIADLDKYNLLMLVTSGNMSGWRIPVWRTPDGNSFTGCGTAGYAQDLYLFAAELTATSTSLSAQGNPVTWTHFTGGTKAWTAMTGSAVGAIYGVM